MVRGTNHAYPPPHPRAWSVSNNRLVVHTYTLRNRTWKKGWEIWMY